MSLAASLGLLALALVGSALADAGTQPSEKGCLVAWNAPANQANHRRLLGQRPSGVQLTPGRFAIDTWTAAGSTTHVSAPACLLALTRSGRVRIAEGRWHRGQVSGWSWGRWFPSAVPFSANVRLLPGGRLAKIYRH